MVFFTLSLLNIVVHSLLTESMRRKWSFPLSLEFELNETINSARSNLNLQGTRQKMTLGNSRSSETHQYSWQGNVKAEKLKLISDKYQKCEIH